jgi:tRNA dimethylallyltransferase
LILNAQPAGHDAGPPNLLVILGATASGKTRLGVELARAFSGEIISADSRQVYRGMDIGTGKDLHEYGGIPYHLIDIAPPGSEFNLFQFQRLFFEAFAGISGRGRLPVLVGGSGMYLDCVLRGYQLSEVPENPELRGELATLDMEQLAERLASANPRLHNSTDLTERARLVRAIEIAECSGAAKDTRDTRDARDTRDTRDARDSTSALSGVAAGGEETLDVSAEGRAHPELSAVTLGIRWERAELRKRITERLKARLEAGMIEEVEQLHACGIPYQQLEVYGLEYRFLARHLKGELSRNDMFQKLNSAIHDFAKKQENWFRKMESHGTPIHWLEGAGDPLREALDYLAGPPARFGVAP